VVSLRKMKYHHQQVNYQNNNSITNSNQAGNTNTIGFNIHEPDTSFVNVRKDNTQQTI
jgi:hypothetical protein